jgi:uncharacterized protein YegL
MDQNAQIPFADERTVTPPAGFESIEFADNPEPRCACVLLLDTSGSMQGPPIAALNLGLRSFKDELVSDALAAKRVDVAVITFGDGPQLAADFTDAASFAPPELRAGGLTPMGAAITDAIARLTARKETYRVNGVAYYRPWVFLITDGEPTDDYAAAAKSVRDGEERGAFSFYGVGVGEANMAKLAEIAPPTRPPVKLDGLRFRDLFVWLSKSMRTVSHSAVGQTIALDPPGWTTTQA